ncbi:site-specific integrase [uncultured Tateyamaria sp.]|uniref:tyrosine-type recombinase/integrase n=1 Tax=uncultured Tateyamaria sp. TaxID=455651 RepID=UPI0026349482|nr:site-specific integrase [uncultured Tateyamaria sp.]
MRLRRMKYVVEDTDRHGNVRIYYRRVGQPKIRLRGPVGSPEFLIDYQRAASGHAWKQKNQGSENSRVGQPGTLRWLCTQYFKSPMYQQLDPSTRRSRRSILERFCENHNDGEKPFAKLLPRHVRVRRDAMMSTPAAANTMIKTLRQLFRFAIRYDLHDSNPAAQVEYLATNAEGYHSWTLEEIKAYEKAHVFGSMARLALALALYTGQRRSDLVRFRWSDVREDDEGVLWLAFTQHKGRNRHPISLEIPIIPELQRYLSEDRAGASTFLTNEYGRPFTAAGFGNRFRKWCDAAGLKNCSVHGLRKAAAARLAELGCSEFEIMAITGHQTSKEVTRYTKGASQKLRAASALRRLSQPSLEEKVSHFFLPDLAVGHFAPLKRWNLSENLRIGSP